MAAPALTALRPVVAVRSLSDDFVEFSLTGVDDAFANALRRVMIAEVRERRGGGGRGTPHSVRNG